MTEMEAFGFGTIGQLVGSSTGQRASLHPDGDQLVVAGWRKEVKAGVLKAAEE